MSRTEYLLRVTLTFVLLGPLTVGLPLLINVPFTIHVAWLVGGGAAAIAGIVFFLFTQQMRNQQPEYWARNGWGIKFSLIGMFSGVLGEIVFEILVSSIKGVLFPPYYKGPTSIFFCLLGGIAGTACGYVMFRQLQSKSKGMRR